MAKFEAGVYLGSFETIYASKLNNEKQTEYIALDFKITHQAVNGEWQELPFETFRHVKWFISPAAEPYTMDKLMKMGFNSDLDNPVFDSWDAKQAILTCKINDNGYEDWDVQLTGTGSNVEPDTDVGKKFEAKFKTYAENRSKPVKAKAADKVVDMKDEISDEDVPF